MRAGPGDDGDRRYVCDRARIVPGNVFELAGVSVLACQELAFILDVHTGERQPPIPPRRGCISCSFRSCRRGR